jgi:hypothetical protein
VVEINYIGKESHRYENKRNVPNRIEVACGKSITGLPMWTAVKEPATQKRRQGKIHCGRALNFPCRLTAP